MSANNGRFPAGPSFLDYDRPDVRMAQLPAWLQTFTATVGDPGEEWSRDDGIDVGPADGPAHVPAAATYDDDPLSGWLDDAESEVPVSASDPNGSIIDPAFMISEDDLPDWLLSIAPSEGEESLGAESVVGSGGVRIPAVSRAWVPESDDAPPIDESASVFALLATQGPQPALPGAGESRGMGDQFHALEQPGPALAHVSGSGAVASKASAAGDAAADAGTSRRASRVPPLLVGVVFAVLVVLIVMFLL